jgi:chromosome segregation ATPase
MFLRKGLSDEVCQGLSEEIVSAQGEISNAEDELIRLQELLVGVHADMTWADGFIREHTEQISACDAEIAGVKEKARQGQIAELQEEIAKLEEEIAGLQEEIAEIDDLLRATEERIAEVLNRLNFESDIPLDANEVAALSLELERLEKTADVLAAQRADLANGAAILADGAALLADRAADLASGASEPALTEAEQDEIGAIDDRRGDAEFARAEFQLFRDELVQEEAEINAARDQQFDRQDAAVELKAELQAEAQAAGCDFAQKREAERPEQDPQQGCDRIVI